MVAGHRRTQSEDAQAAPTRPATGMVDRLHDWRRANPMKVFAAFIALVAALTTVILTRPATATPADQVELEVPTAMQIGEISNCGPTAAAMLVASFRLEHDPHAIRKLRDRIGQWSWDKYPLRRLSVFGSDAGMTSPAIMGATLARFGGHDARFDALSHPWLPREAYAVIALKGLVREGRPIVALVKSSALWGNDASGLHWVVVRGFEGDQVIFNDPADGSRATLPLHDFMAAWRLDKLFRSLPTIGAFTAFVPDRALPGMSEFAMQMDHGPAHVP